MTYLAAKDGGRSMEERLAELERSFSLLNDAVQGIRDDLDIAIKGARDRERSVEEALDRVQFTVSVVEELVKQPEMLDKLAGIAERIRLRGLQGLKDDAHATMLLDDMRLAEDRLRDLTLRAEAEDSELQDRIDLARAATATLQTAIDAAKEPKPWWKRLWSGR